MDESDKISEAKRQRGKESDRINKPRKEKEKEMMNLLKDPSLGYNPRPELTN